MTDSRATVTTALTRFDGKPSSDFGIWELRLIAALKSRGLAHCVDKHHKGHSSTSYASSSSSAPKVPTKEDKEKASTVIIEALGDRPLRIVSALTEDPRAMMKKLRNRYASASVISKSSILAELYALKYRSGEMAEYIDKFTGLLDRLTSMDAEIPEELAKTIFLSSMDGKFEATVAALSVTDNITWDKITNTMIEASTRHRKGHYDQSALVMNTAKSDATSVTVTCVQCSKPGHRIENCWWNPNNPRNRLPKEKKAQNKVKNAVANQATNDDQQSQPSETGPSGRGNDQTNERQRKRSSKKDKLIRLNVTSVYNNSHEDNSFLLDSGASAHTCPKRHWFQNLHPIPKREIRLGDDSVVMSEAAGDITFSIPYHTGGTLTMTIGDVLYVSTLGLNLLSCAKLGEKGIDTIFHNQGCDLINRNDNNDLITSATLSDNLYWIQNAKLHKSQEHMQSASTRSIDINVWHNRLAHVSKDKIAYMLRTKQLDPVNTKTKSDPCYDCFSGKQTRGPFKGHIDKATKTGEVIHSDVVGPLPKSLSGCKYFVSFIDEWTRYTTVMPIARKSQVLNCFKQFRVSFEKQYDATIKSIHSDNGGEYTPVEKYATSRGIKVTRAAPYNPEANGIAERMNRTLIEAVRTMLAQSGLSQKFWVEAMRNAVSIRNLIPRDKNVSPHEAILHKSPNFHVFRPFGCLAKVHVRKGGRQKLDSKSTSSVLLSTIGHRNYRLFDLETGKITVARNVIFSEDVFPAKRENKTDGNNSDTASHDLSTGSSSDSEVKIREVNFSDNSSTSSFPQIN